MTGLDTTVLLEFEIAETPRHRDVRAGVFRYLEESKGRFVLTPQVLQEFVHVATDPKRFENPLSMAVALERVSFWWNASETARIYPGDLSTALAFRWMEEFRLGRKRILDTCLAAIYHTGGVTAVATANADDFRVFGCFDIINLADN